MIEATLSGLSASWTTDHLRCQLSAVTADHKMLPRRRAWLALASVPCEATGTATNVEPVALGQRPLGVFGRDLGRSSRPESWEIRNEKKLPQLKRITAIKNVSKLLLHNRL